MLRLFFVVDMLMNILNILIMVFECLFASDTTILLFFTFMLSITLMLVEFFLLHIEYIHLYRIFIINQMKPLAREGWEH